MTVTKFPVEKVYPDAVGGREVWAQTEPSQEMVWAICPYTRSNQHAIKGDNRCLHCPRYEEDPDYGLMSRGCYVMAAEACRIVFAMQAREKTNGHGNPGS